MSKESAFTKALVLIDWEIDAPIPVLRCPITGKVIASGYDPATGEMAEGYGEPKWQEVPTVLFHYVPEVGEFDYIKPELQAKVDSKRKELGEDAEELDDFEIRRITGRCPPCVLLDKRDLLNCSRHFCFSTTGSQETLS
jgi:hypothetical protein